MRERFNLSHFNIQIARVSLIGSFIVITKFTLPPVVKMQAFTFLFLCFLSSFAYSTFNPPPVSRQQVITETKSTIESRFFDLTIDYKESDFLKSIFSPVIEKQILQINQEILKNFRHKHGYPARIGKLLQAYAMTVIDHFSALQSFSEYQTNYAAYKVFGYYFRRHFSYSLQDLVSNLAKHVSKINNYLPKFTPDVLDSLKILVPPPSHDNYKDIYYQILSGIMENNIEEWEIELERLLLGEDKIKKVVEYVEGISKTITFPDILYMELKGLFSEFEKKDYFASFIDSIYSFTLFHHLLFKFPDSKTTFNVIFPNLDCDVHAPSGIPLCEDMNVKEFLQNLNTLYYGILKGYTKDYCIGEAKLEELKGKCIQKINEGFSNSIPTSPSKKPELPSHPPATPILTSDDQVSKVRILPFGKEEDSSKGPSHINFPPPKEKFEVGLPDVPPASDHQETTDVKFPASDKGRSTLLPVSPAQPSEVPVIPSKETSSIPKDVTPPKTPLVQYTSLLAEPFTKIGPSPSGPPKHDHAIRQPIAPAESIEESRETGNLTEDSEKVPKELVRVSEKKTDEGTMKMEIINGEGKTGEETEKNKGEPDKNIDGEKNKKKTKDEEESEKPGPGGPSSPNYWDNRKIAIIISSVAGGLAVVGACVAAYYFSKRGKNQTPSLSA